MRNNNKPIPESKRRLKEKIMKDIEEALGGSTEPLRYEDFVRLLKRMNFVSLRVEENQKESDLIADLWKAIGGLIKGSVAREVVEHTIMFIMGLTENETGTNDAELTGMDKKKFGPFKANRLCHRKGRNQSQNSNKSAAAAYAVPNTTTASNKVFVFSPKISEKSNKLALASRQKAVTEKCARMEGSNNQQTIAGAGNSLSTPDLLNLQQAMRDE